MMRDRAVHFAFAIALGSSILLYAGEGNPAPYEVMNAFVWEDSVMTVQRDGSVWQHGIDRQWRRVLHDRSWRYADSSGSRLWLLDRTGTIWRRDGSAELVSFATTPSGSVAVALAAATDGVYVHLATESRGLFEFWWYPGDGTEPTGPIRAYLPEEAEESASPGASGFESMLQNHLLITGAGERLIAMLSFRDLIFRCSSERCTEVSWVSPRTQLEETEEAVTARFGEMGRVPQLRVWDVASGPEGGFVALLGITSVDERDGAISQRDQVALFSESGKLLKKLHLKHRGVAVAGHKDGQLLAVLNEKSELDWLELERSDEARSK